MRLYKKCLSVVGNTPYFDGPDRSRLDIVSANENNLGMPQFLQRQFNEFSNSNFSEAYYISDIHLPHKIIKKFEKTPLESKIRNYVKEIAVGLFSEELIKSLNSSKNPIIIFGGDISSSFELSKIFYTEFMKKWEKIHKEFRAQREKYYTEIIPNKEFLEKLLSGPDEKRIYAVLGNHEFWDFENIDTCYNTYRDLFQSLGIILLENTICEVCNMVVVGGTGFAGWNNKFNADTKLYRLTLNRDEEIEQCRLWAEVYNKAIRLSREKDKPLIVITHNPLSDWKQDAQPHHNCVYFNGHTHKNNLYHDEERNIHIYANNQVGYENPIAEFKRAYLYERANPFASYDDGYWEISSGNYLKFYDYMCETISGNKLVERQINKNNAKFYMIKHKEYYGFFVISPTTSYICAGGHIRKIGKAKDIEEFDKDFLRIIDRYLITLSPYRNAQENIAKAIKTFGGTGTIHGCIIDIDFFNHVMLNPSDGKITYYYSPQLGYVEPYDNMLALLESHNKELAVRYRKRAGLLEGTLTTQNLITSPSNLIKVDIKNSIYKVSNRMNQIQRLFDKKILREWNEEFLKNDVIED